MNQLEHITHIQRDLAARYGREAVEIITAGSYRSPSGKSVNINSLISNAKIQTITYSPERTVPDHWEGAYQTNILVNNETSLSAAIALIAQGIHPAVLNFASATSPGGGFLKGARAQEEYLTRSSGLYTCLAGNEMYNYHREHYDPLYSDYVIPGFYVARSVKERHFY